MLLTVRICTGNFISKLGVKEQRSLSKPRQSRRLTCSYKENPSTENDVPFAFVEAAGSNTDSTQQEQYGAEDGEDAGGSHHACRRGQNYVILCTEIVLNFVNFLWTLLCLINMNILCFPNVVQLVRCFCF